VNTDAILQAFNAQKTDYILIGGMNFLLNHAPILTQDVDIWIEDSPENRTRANSALIAANAEWGATEAEWRPVASSPDWMERQNIFCLTSAFGAIDLFRQVKGLDGEYAACRNRARKQKTPMGVAYLSLCDEDMLRCQLALEPADRKLDRIRTLEDSIRKRRNG